MREKEEDHKKLLDLRNELNILRSGDTFSQQTSLTVSAKLLSSRFVISFIYRPLFYLFLFKFF